MKATLLIFLLFVQFSAVGHEYYFSFAEVEYNPFTEVFEATVSVSAHDLDVAWEDLELSIDSLSYYTKESKAFSVVETNLLKGFQIYVGDELVDFSILGIEVLLDGMIHFYLQSSPMALPSSIYFSFDLLMDKFKKQQNKLTYRMNGKVYVASFLYNQRSKHIVLEN